MLTLKEPLISSSCRRRPVSRVFKSFFKKSLFAVSLGLMLSSPLASATDVIEVRLMTLSLASDIAAASVKTCADAGYQVSAVVVDRSGTVQVVMRDVFASRFTTEIAERKANAVILSGVGTGEFKANRADILAEMNEVDGILVLEGGLPIWSAGSLLGAIGVSGAPGGDKDAVCAQAGLESVLERLEFAIN